MKHSTKEIIKILIPVGLMIFIVISYTISALNKENRLIEYCKEKGYDSNSIKGNGEMICYDKNLSSNNCITQSLFGQCQLYANNFIRVEDSDLK